MSRAIRAGRLIRIIAIGRREVSKSSRLERVAGFVRVAGISKSTRVVLVAASSLSSLSSLSSS